MKKQSVQLYLIIWSIFTIPTYIFGMSPAQVAQKERQFNQILNQYKQEASKSGVLTTRGAQLFQDAIKIINELSKYVTTDKLKQQLLSIQTESQKQIVDQRAAVQLNNLIDLFGTAQKTSPKKSTKASPGSIAYYNDLANKVMSDGLSILQNFYPTDQQSAVRNNVLYVGQNDVKGMLELAPENKGGALYWINHHLDTVFNLMNMFGNEDGEAAYGHDDMPNFINSRNYFLQNLRDFLETMYNVSSNGNIGSNKINKLLLPNKTNYAQLLDIKNESGPQNKGKTLLGWLYQDLADYNLFVRNIMQANNITQAIDNMKQSMESIQISYPKLDENKKFIMISEKTIAEETHTLKFTTLSNAKQNLIQAISTFSQRWQKAGEHLAEIAVEKAEIAHSENMQEQRANLEKIALEHKKQLQTGKAIMALENSITEIFKKSSDKPTEYTKDALEKWFKGSTLLGGQNMGRTQLIQEIFVAILNHMTVVFQDVEQKELLQIQYKEVREIIEKKQTELTDLTKGKLAAKEGAEEAQDALQEEIRQQEQKATSLLQQIQQASQTPTIEEK